MVSLVASSQQNYPPGSVPRKLVSFRLLPGYQVSSLLEEHVFFLLLFLICCIFCGGCKQRICFLPRFGKVLPVQSSPMQMPQLTLLLICDVSARVFCFAAFGLCFRPAVRMSENRQFALPLLMLAELAVVVWLTTRFLNKRWFHSVENTRDAVLSTTISYFTIPALALHTQSNDAVVDFSGMMKLQRVISYGRAAELFVTLCLVWYHCHIQVYPSRVYIRIFALWSLLGLACVLITRAYDRASRHEGRPILPAVGSQGFSPAHWACALDNVDLLRKLDEKEDVMDAPDENFRHPVHIAALYGREDALRVLHKVNATCIMAKDQAGWTPAHCAAHIGHEKVLELLLSWTQSAFRSRMKREGPLHTVPGLW